MKRREFVALLGAATACPLAANAQRARPIPRVGVLWHGGSAEEEAVYLGAVRQGLSDFGYVEGQNVTLENRFAAEIPERFSQLAAELAALNRERSNTVNCNQNIDIDRRHLSPKRF